MSDNASYYAERAAEERRLAMASKDLKVRGIHLDMAGKYDGLAGANASRLNASRSDGEQKTA